MNKFTVIALFALFFVAVFAFPTQKELNQLLNFLPKDVSGKKYCPTEDVYRWKKTMRLGEKAAAACRTEGVCDVPEERNRWDNNDIEIGLTWNVICASASNCPVNNTVIDAQMKQINKDYKGTGFTFEIEEIRYIANSTYAEIAAYGSSNLWYTQLLTLKNAFAKRPERTLNVFVTRQKSGSSGTLLGIGTFPWDSDALTNIGGLWLNAVYVGADDKTASHEIGHCIGLWHTFHGDSEVSCTNACHETVHNETDNTGPWNEVGDFCADTPAQPMNYNCRVPTTRNCKNHRYDDVRTNLRDDLINNIMAYTPDDCMEKITRQQSWRSACWTCARLRGWVENRREGACRRN